MNHIIMNHRHSDGDKCAKSHGSAHLQSEHRRLKMKEGHNGLQSETQSRNNR